MKMHGPPRSGLCLYLASGFWRVLWLDLVTVDVYTTFYQSIPICQSPPAVSMVWPRRYLGQWKFAFGKPFGQIVSVSVCVRKIIKVFPRFQEFWVFSLTATFWPRLKKSDTWQFPFLDRANINVYTKFYQKIPYGWRHTKISVFSHFFFSVKGKCRFRILLPWSKESGIWQAYCINLVGIYQYAKIYQIILNCLIAVHFANCPRTDRQTVSQGDYRALFESQPSIGRLFCGSCNQVHWPLYNVHLS